MAEESKSADERVDLLVIVFLASEQAGELSSALLKSKFRMTLVNASGGFLQTGITCMFVGTLRERYAELLNLIETICHTRRRFIPAGNAFVLPEAMPPIMVEAEVGAAHVFTLEVEHYEYF